MIKDDERKDDEMHRRRITLKDGRYMIFYTFGEEQRAPAPEDASAAYPEPRAENEAEEERHV